MSGRRRENVSGWISRVLRLRALTPMTLAPASTARWVSTSSCTSTRAVMPSSPASREQGGQLGVGEGRDDEQHEVGPVGPGLPDLVVADHEVLAQHRDLDGGPDRVEVVEAAPEAAPLGEHRDRGGPAGRVGRGERGGVGDVGEGALARAGPLDLGDERETRAAEHGLGVEGRAGVEDGALDVGAARCAARAPRGPRGLRRRSRRGRWSRCGRHQRMDGASSRSRWAAP